MFGLSILFIVNEKVKNFLKKKNDKCKFVYLELINKYILFDKKI